MILLKSSVTLNPLFKYDWNQKQEVHHKCTKLLTKAFHKVQFSDNFLEPLTFLSHQLQICHSTKFQTSTSLFLLRLLFLNNLVKEIKSSLLSTLRIKEGKLSPTCCLKGPGAAQCCICITFVNIHHIVNMPTCPQQKLPLVWGVRC